jgi:hypothetical protein
VTIGGEKTQPSDASLTTSAGLYLKPIERSPYDDDRGPDRYVGTARPSGVLGQFVSEWGPVWGWLDVTANGLRWRPRARSARWGYRVFEIDWRQITGADFTRMLVSEGRDALLMVETVDTRVEFLVPFPEEERLREALSEFLDSPGPPLTGKLGLP